MHEYDLIADWYASQRIDATGVPGVPEVTALIALLPPSAAVLDVGCGNGLPLTRVLIDHGCNVLGVDSSPKMLERFAENFPGVPTICAPIQSCDLNGLTFDATIMWGVMFHLPYAEQAKAVAKIASVLKPGAPFLFTSGDEIDDEDAFKDGEPMNGVPFRYYSHSRDGYSKLLSEHGLRLEETHRDKGENIYYLARKTL